MSSKALLLSLFRHKAWANSELFAQVAKLDPAANGQERHTAIRLLNHIYVVDRIFAAHLMGTPHPYSAPNTTETPTLDELHAAAGISDAWYVDYIQGLAPQRFTEAIEFKFTDGLPGRMSREEMLAHVITHGSYHRGAVGRVLSQASVQPPRDIFTVYLHTAEPQRRGG